MADCKVTYPFVREAIVDKAMNMVMATNLFKRIADDSFVSNNNVDNQSVIDNINIKFGTELIFRENDLYLIDPSDKLINDYLLSDKPAKAFGIDNNDDTYYNLKMHGTLDELQNVLLDDLANHSITKDLTNILSKRNNEYYLSSTRKGMQRTEDKDREVILKGNKKRLVNQLNFRKINPDIFKFEESTTADGQKVVRVVKNNVPIDKLGTTNKSDRVAAITDFLAERFGLANNIVHISRTEFRKQNPDIYKSNMTSAVVGDKIYLFQNELTNDIVAEEMLHPFINGLHKVNVGLFNNLLDQARKEFPGLVAMVEELYADQPEIQRKKEIVTKVLAIHFANEEEAPKPFRDAVKEFVSWIEDILKDMLEYFGYTRIDSEDLPSNLTFNDLVKLINTTDTKFETDFDGLNYNLKEEAKVNKDAFDFVISGMGGHTEGLLKAFAKLPKQVKIIKNRLLDIDPRSEEGKKLATLLSEAASLEEREDQAKAEFNMIISVSKVFTDLGTQINIIDRNEKDPKEKLRKLNDINKVFISLEPFTRIIKDLRNQLNRTVSIPERVEAKVKELESLNTQLKAAKDLGDFALVARIQTAINKAEPIAKQALSYRTFYQQLNAAIAIPEAVKQDIIELSHKPLIDIFTEWNAILTDNKAKAINEKILDYTQKVKDSTTDAERKRNKKILAELQKDVERLPTKSHFEKKFAGMILDASSGRNLFDAKANNPDTILSTMQGMLNEIDDKVKAGFLQDANEVQTAQDKLVKAVGETRDVEKRNAPITSYVKWTTKMVEQPDGTLVPEIVTRREYLNEVDPKYLEEYSTLKATQEFYNDKLADAREKEDTESIKKYQDLQREHNTAMREWLSKNAQREFLDEVYDMYAIMDAPIALPDGKTTSLRKEKGEIWMRIQTNTEVLQGTTIPSERDRLRDELNSDKIELKQLRNRYDATTGELKTGVELALAEAAIKYSELSKKYGDWEVTDEGLEAFKADVEELKYKLAQNSIDQATYDHKMSQITREEISQDLYDIRAKAQAKVDALRLQLKDLKDEGGNRIFDNVFSDKEEEAIEGGYDKMREEVRPYRDDDYVIDGITLSKDNPELVKRVKATQEAIEKIRQESEKLKDLSSKEQKELKDLKAKVDKTDADSARETELLAIQSQRKSTYRQNKAVIDEYNKALTFLYSLFDSTTTHYYTKAKDKQFNEFKTSESVQKIVNAYFEGTTIQTGSRTFEKSGNKWHEVINEKISVEEFQEGYIRSIIENHEANAQFQDSDWWKANHYKVLRFDKGSNQIEEVDEPIYIWKQQKATNEDFINTTPSSMYQNYKVKEEFVNTDFKTIANGVPAPRPGSYVNKRYTDLKNSTDEKDKAYFEFLEFSKQFQAKSDERNPPRRRLGNFMPSMPKTEAENTVQLTNKAMTDPKGWGKDVLQRAIPILMSAQTEDEQFAQGGGLQNTKNIPIRFTSQMDSSKQSADISAMLLAYSFTSAKYQELNESLPIFESLQRVARDMGVQEVKTVADTLLLTPFKKAFKKEQFEKDLTNKQSNLSKGVDSSLDMFVYGQTSKAASTTIWGRKIDLQKVTSEFLGFTAKTIFIGGLFPGIKNSLATRLELIKQANKQQGFYGLSNIATAQAQLAKHLPTLAGDYRKAGNRSFIGQILQLYDVSPEDILRHTNEKINYNLGADKFTFLMAPKAFSEFESIVMQFLTIADAKQVEMEDGTKVPLIEAYWINPATQKLEVKPGAKFSDRDRTIFKELFRKLTRDISGAYRLSEKSEFETEWYGKAATFMSKYLVPGVIARTGRRQWSMEYGDITEGFYSSTIKSIQSLVRDYSGNVMELWAESSPQQKSAMIKTGRELAIVLIMAGIIALMGGGDGGDDKKKNSWMYNFMLAEMMAVKTETETFIPGPGFGLDDIVRKAQSPFMAMNQVKNLVKLVALLQMTIFNSDEAYYQQKTGLHDKGDSKFIAQFWRILGFTGKTFHPIELIKGQEALTRIR